MAIANSFFLTQLGQRHFAQEKGSFLYFLFLGSEKSWGYIARDMDADCLGCFVIVSGSPLS